MIWASIWSLCKWHGDFAVAGYPCFIPSKVSYRMHSPRVREQVPTKRWNLRNRYVSENYCPLLGVFLDVSRFTGQWKQTLQKLLITMNTHKYSLNPPRRHSHFGNWHYQWPAVQQFSNISHSSSTRLCPSICFNQSIEEYHQSRLVPSLKLTVCPWKWMVGKLPVLLGVCLFSGANLLLHPWRLTWNIIMEVWKIIFLSKWVICMFHVNLTGCSFRIPGSFSTLQTCIQPSNPYGPVSPLTGLTVLSA